MITSIRSIIVDYLKTVDSVNSIVDDRITDIDYNFEDLYGASANDSMFPAISIESTGAVPEYATNCDDVNQYTEPLNIQLYQQVTTQHLRAKSPTVKEKAVNKLRDLDSLKEAVLNNLNTLRGNLDFLVDIHMVRIINGGTDSTFSTANKSTIYQSQISINITYSKGAV
jgi:hypothetical protein|tara:strand:+ start:2227 stop:2733 length:507 start_codon:yes stop_codon:yes gene_type:complete